MISSRELEVAISEFYSSNAHVEPSRRIELNRMLIDAQHSSDAWRMALELLQMDKPHPVQFFAVNCLYETVSSRWDECMTTPENVEVLKRFLIEKLTLNAHVQSIMNKLSSTLGLVALHCIPEIWENPVADLTALWLNDPELLLRVLAEFPTELPRAKVSLQHRAIIKGELHNSCKDIIAIVSAVLCQDESPSLRNAAVDCVEQWLKLSGVPLSDWRPLLVAVFQVIQGDCAGLGRLLLVLSNHGDLCRLEALVLDLYEFIGCGVAVEWDSRCSSNELTDEDLVTLLSAAVELVETTIDVVLVKAGVNDQRSLNALKTVCDLFVRVSSVAGKYPVDEHVSDLCATFWTTAREDTITSANSRLTVEERTSLVNLLKPYYAMLLQSAVDKLAYPSPSVWNQWDLDSREQFENYRLSQADISTNAYFLLGGETIQFLMHALEQSWNDVEKCEAILYLWEQTADYLTEREQNHITSLLQIGQQVPVKCNERLTNTFLRLISSLSHLISNGKSVAKTYPQAVSICLNVLSADGLKGCCAESLKTLENFVEKRLPVLEPAYDQLISVCQSCFFSEQDSSKVRLGALKCLGFSLSQRPPHIILEFLNSLLAPRLSNLQASLNSSTNLTESQLLFELDVISTLIVTLEGHNHASVSSSKVTAALLRLPFTDGGAPNSSSCQSPVLLVLQQSLPLFQLLVKVSNSNPNVVHKICDALRNGLGALLENAAPLVPGYCEIVSDIIVDSPAAFGVVKNLFLVFGSSDSNICEALSHHWVQWSNAVSAKCAMNIECNVLEPYLGLCYQLAKKQWTRFTGKVGIDALPNIIDCSISVLQTSLEAPLVKQSAALMAFMVHKGTEGNPEVMQLFAGRAQMLIQVSYARLQTEILTSSVEFLADILYVFAKLYPSEIRTVLSGALHDTPLLTGMLAEISNKRRFREFAKRINLASRKSQT